MLRKEDLVVGTRIKWQAINIRKPVFFGTIVGVTGDEILVSWDGQEDANTFVYTDATSIHLAE
jgi:hypothetical protein